MQWHCTFQILESWPWPQGNPIITRYAWKTRKALWTLIDVRLKAAKVRFSQFLEYSEHCITSAKERREGKRYLYTSTRLLVVFSLSWTLYFTTVDSDNYTLYSYASVFVWKRRFFSPLWPWPPTRILWIRSTKTFLFKTALKNGDFWKRRFAVLDYQPLFGKSAHAHENGVFWKRLRHGLRYLGMRILLSKMVPFSSIMRSRFR